jgi:O-antigen/teichoic acid export membrane protein
VARNALSGGGRYAIGALLGLIVTPYALSVLGTERFGLWAVAGAVLTVVRLLDLGLGRAMTRAVAGAMGRGSPGTARPALDVGRGMLALIGASLAATVFVLRGPIVGALLHVPPALTSEAGFVIVGTAAVGALEGLFAPSRAVLDGVGRMDLSNGIDTVQRILSALGVVVVLWAGWGLQGLVWKNMLLALGTGLVLVLVVRRTVPELAPLRLAWDRDVAGEMLRFGRHVQTVGLTGVAMDVGGKLVLSRVVGLSSVAAFEIAMRVAGQMAGALMAASTAVFPAAAEAGAARESEAHTGGLSDRDAALLAMHSASARYLSWLALPSFSILIVLSLPFVAAWLGPGHVDVATTLAILAAGYLVAVLSMPAHMVCQASGRERVSTVAATSTAVVGLTAAALLAREFGLAGAVTGVAMGLAVGGLAMWWLFARAFDVGLGGMVFVSGRSVVAALAAAVCAGALGVVLSVSLLAVVLAASAGLALFVALLVVSGEVSDVDRAVLSGAVRARPGSSSGPGA